MSEKETRLKELEEKLQSAELWEDKENAQEVVREYNELKAELAERQKLEKRDALVTVFAGAGGEDAEDFAAILFRMYRAYAENNGWDVSIVHENRNEHDGINNVTFEISGENAYGTLKHESGVHRLVRISPFSAKKQRHTSFAMVDVVPKLPKTGTIDIADSDVNVEFSKSSGPGGQNVNKRETAVRVTHIPTDITVHADAERSQQANRERAMELLKGKLYRKAEEERRAREEGHSISKTTDAEWGNHIRSYVFHPYQMVKDHRTGVELQDVDSVLDGNIQPFIDAM